MNTGEFFILLLLLVLIVVPAIQLLFTIQEILKEISPHNRRFRPSYVWFLLIPVVGTIYTFFLAVYLSLSIKLELRERGVPVARYPTLAAGLLLTASYVLSLAHSMYFNTKLPFFVCIILYWFQLAQYKRKLINTTPPKNVIA